MKVIFNYATRQFESMEPTLRDRFMLGGRVDFNQGGMAQLVAILNKLPAGTDITRELVEEIVSNNNINVSINNFFSRNTDKLKKGLNVIKRKAPIKITPEVLEKFDNYVKNTDLDIKSIGEKFGFKKTKGTGLDTNSLLYKEYVKKYGEPDLGRFKEYRLTADKGLGKKILTAYDKRVKQFGPGKYISQIVKEVYGPGVKDFDGARRTVRRLLETERGYKGKANIAIDKKDLTAEQIKTKARVKKLKPIDDETIRKFMAGPKDSGLQYHHSDATKTSPVTLRNVIYVPSDVNNYIQKYEGPITQRKKEIEKLIKNKPDGYKKQIDTKLKQIRNTITKANIDLDKAGYSAFKNIIEVDTVDPFGKKIKIGGNTALKIGSDLAVEIGLDPDKPLKQYTPEERIKLVKAKEALLDISKQNIPDLTKVKPELDLKSKIKSYATQGRNTIQKFYNKLPGKTLRMAPGAAAAAADFAIFAGVLGTPIDEAVVGASGWLTKKPELAKALGTIATQYSEGKMTFAELKEKSLPILKEIGKEQLPESKLPPVAEEINEKMGEGTIKIADDVPESESAERRRMFEEANERFGNIDEMEISDIDNPFMAAMGGRVGFKDGSPDPFFVDSMIAAFENPNVANQFIKDNQPSVGEMILGKEGDRTLMQSFNTQFLDPRSYPYYAQKTLRGAANIPELAVRFPLAAAYIFGKASLATSTADLSKFSMEDIRTAMEILEPKFTNLALEGKLGDVLGLSPEAIQAVEEKRTGPQKTTGSLLQFGAEAVGPASPVFLFKMFPKLPKQIKDLVGTATAADKVNKEIESRMATQGVDQTRRDLLIATGVGGAVGLLKMLGLDNLFKAAPKAVAKKGSEIITSGGTPKYFFDFVNLIKKKGKDISDEAATVERQRVYDYNDYTLYENLDTNTIRITKDTEGASSYYIGDGEYDTVTGIIRKEEITYTPKETIINDKGKPVEVKDTYDEGTVRPDYDGKEGDYEAGLDSIDEILDLLSKDGKTYSDEELLKMGIDPNLTNVPTGAGTIPKDMIGEVNPFKSKVKKAGGGIMKMAGDESGPPPKSGPTPHGLPYVAKNVRPIKERK